MLLAASLATALAMLLVVRRRAFGGKVYLWALSILLLAFSALVLYLTADAFTGQGIDASVFFHLAVLSIPLLLQFWPLLLGVCAFFLLCLFLLWDAWKRRNFCPSAGKPVEQWMDSKFLLGISLVLALSLQPAWPDFWSAGRSHFDKRGVAEFAEQMHYGWRAEALVPARSFIYIYAESLGQVFFDQARYPALTPELNRLMASGVRVDGVVQAAMTGWTLAGMVASQCGVPQGIAAKPLESKAFRQPVVCIGDFLQRQGYHLSFLGGASLDFANKGQFYREHGFVEVMGREDWRKQFQQSLPESTWGIYDDDLLRLARQKLEDLQAAQQPFGLFLLTLDTHPPNGHLTPACINQFYRQDNSDFLNAVHCADSLLALFISQLLADPRYRDVTIILASDHLVTRNSAWVPVGNSGGVNTWIVFNSAEELEPVSRAATMMDIAPTLLHVLGYRVDAIGLGRNLFTGQSTLIEKYGLSELNRLLLAWLGGAIDKEFKGEHELPPE